MEPRIPYAKTSDGVSIAFASIGEELALVRPRGSRSSVRPAAPSTAKRMPRGRLRRDGKATISESAATHPLGDEQQRLHICDVLQKLGSGLYGDLVTCLVLDLVPQRVELVNRRAHFVAVQR